MSIWSDLQDRSSGAVIRTEDIRPVYFKVLEQVAVILHNFEPGEEMTFNENTDKECVGEYITCSRISAEPIFKLVEGKKSFIENGVTVSGYKHPFNVSFLEPLSNLI